MQPDSETPQQVLDSRNLLENIFQSSTEYSIIAKDLQKRILTWNEGARRNYGYEADEVLGRSAAVLHAPEDLQSGLFDDLHDRALRDGSATGTLNRVRKDGTRFIASVVITRRDGPDGQPIGYLLISRDVTEERRLQEELESKVRELEQSNDTIRRQRDEMLELSSPVMEIWDQVLALPLIGTLDTVRAQQITETLLNAIARTKARIVIVDISGVPTVDTAVAQNIIRTTEAARLMGARSIISGVRPAIAQTIVHLGITLGSVRTEGTLRNALEAALYELGTKPATWRD